MAGGPEPSSRFLEEPRPFCKGRATRKHTLSPFSAPQSKISPTETERCIESLLAVFQRYAGREGDNLKLSKKEFLAFMNTELASFTKVSESQARRLPGQ